MSRKLVKLIYATLRRYQLCSATDEVLRIVEKLLKTLHEVNLIISASIFIISLRIPLIYFIFPIDILPEGFLSM